MKIKLTFLLLFLSSIVFADGGDLSGKCYVAAMDASHNLFYSSVDGVLTIYNRKGKPEEYDVTSNISIYDINTGKVSYLFPDTLNERIYEFNFESHYDSLNHQMAFNGSNDGYDWPNTTGNYAIQSRTPSDKIFIITYSYRTDRYSLWIAHKTGAELKRIYEYSDDATFYFDVKNKAIRFVRQAGDKIEVKDMKY